MTIFSRTDRTLLNQWVWTVDKWMLYVILFLLFAGFLLIIEASRSDALKLNLPEYHFVIRHTIFSIFAIFSLFFISFLKSDTVMKLSWLLFLGALLAVALTLVIGEEINGARRWFPLLSFSLQPSEFLKPSFTVITAWIFLQWKMKENHWYLIGGFLLMGVITVLLFLQPDISMAFILTCVWLTQLFMIGITRKIFLILSLLGSINIIIAYVAFSHVQKRLGNFVAKLVQLFTGQTEDGDTGQAEKALEHFSEGRIILPEPGRDPLLVTAAHNDFILAAASKIFGFTYSLILIILIGVLIFRGFYHMWKAKDGFIYLVVGGIITQIGLQSLLHIATNLSLIPTIGLTLPLISYGGSSLLATAISLGIVLALARQQIFR